MTRSEHTAGLEVEDVEKVERLKPVAQYVLERDDGDRWELWLQTHRTELNVLTTPEFIAWLDRKMEQHGEGKLIPPTEVVEQEFEERLETEMREVVTERILREARLEEQVAAALAAVDRCEPRRRHQGDVRGDAGERMARPHQGAGRNRAGAPAAVNRKSGK